MKFAVHEVSEMRSANYTEARRQLGDPTDEPTLRKALKVADLQTKKQVGAEAWQQYKVDDGSRTGRNPLKYPNDVVNGRRSSRKSNSPTTRRRST